MKKNKTISIMLLVILIPMVLFGCDSSEKSNKDENKPTTLTQSSAEVQTTEKEKISESTAIRLAKSNVEKRLTLNGSRKVGLVNIGSAEVVERGTDYYKVVVKGTYHNVDEYGRYGYEWTFDETFHVDYYDGYVW